VAKALTSKKTKSSGKRIRAGGKTAKSSSKKSKKSLGTTGRGARKSSAARKKASKVTSAGRATGKAKAAKRTSSAKKSKPKKSSTKKARTKKARTKKTPAKKTPAKKTKAIRAKAGTKAGKVSSKAKTKAKTGKAAAATKTKRASGGAASTPRAPAPGAARKKAAEAVRKSVTGKGAKTSVPTPEPAAITVEEALASLPYTEGQFVVHPKYGLGRVDRITERKLSTRTVPCLEISFSYQEMRLTIPVDQVERSGLRRPIGKKSIDDVFKVLRGRATFDAKRRSAKRVVDYRKRLGQGDPTSLAEAVRDLARLSLRKSLSYEERKILSTALRILSREVALARGREPDDVREEIEKIVYR
jgi:RNA polymerase-interacting CarD/CdnL/TRCF family regulator